MKILWFSHFVPFPPQGGNRQRSFNLIRQVSKQHEVTLITFNLDGESLDELEGYRRELGLYCKEIHFWELPTKWRSPIWALKLLFSPFSRLPYSCNAFWSSSLAARLQKKIETSSFDLIHIDSIDLARYLGEMNSLTRVLNHHNCESAMTYRRAEIESNWAKKFYLAQQARKIDALEKDICHKFDVNTVVSESDGRLLSLQSSRAQIRVVENGTDTDFFAPMPDLEEPNTLVFAGSLHWYPNVSGLKYFVTEVWPIIKQSLPSAKLYIAGKDPGDSFQNWLEQSPDVEVVRSPADIRPWMAMGAVFICPILDGGGTRLKLLDAMSMGRAIVSTTIGCEGLGVQQGKHMMIADKPSEIAEQVLELLRNKELRLSLSAQGRDLVQKRYSWNSIGVCLLQAYEFARGKK